jgi:hypothetical protein
VSAVKQNKQCAVTGCTGVCAPTLDACFVHADRAGFDHAFAEASSGEEVNLDLRGTPLDQAAVDRLLAACPADPDGRKLLGDVDISDARPTGPLKLSNASFGRLLLSNLNSDYELKLELVVRSHMAMYDMRCVGLNLHLAGRGKVICDRLFVRDVFSLTLGEYAGDFRGSPVTSDTTVVRATSQSGQASLQLDVLGDDCVVAGGTLARLELLQARLDRGLTISDVDAHEGIWLTDTHATELHLEHCTGAGLVLDGIRVAGDIRASQLALGSLWARDSRVEYEAIFRDVKLERLSVGADAQFGALDLAGCSVTELLDVTDAQLGHLALDKTELARTSLSAISVSGHASLRDAVLSAPLLISDAQMTGGLSLNGMNARQGATLSGVSVGDVLGAFRAEIGGDFRGTAVSCDKMADLRELQVDGSLALELSADTIDLSDATIAGTSRLRVHANVLRLVGTTLQSRGELESEGRPQRACALDLRAIEPRERLLIDGRERTALIDLRRARCDGIRLQAVALERCLFDAATGLEEMRLTGESFARRAPCASRGRVVLAEDPAFDRSLLRDRAGTISCGRRSVAAAEPSIRTATLVGVRNESA